MAVALVGGIRCRRVSALPGRVVLVAERGFSLGGTPQLQALCAASSRLMPRVRHGVRIEVFSGLLQLAFADALQGQIIKENAPYLLRDQTE